MVGERALGLNLSSMSDKVNADFLDAPVEPKELFGPTVAAMRQKWDLDKKVGEAPIVPDIVPTWPTPPQAKASWQGEGNSPIWS